MKTTGNELPLTHLANVQSFEVGESEDFGEEIANARKNVRLVQFLEERAKKAKSRRGKPIAEVRKRLRL